MKYITTKEASEIWGISDRRIRVLCREGRIPGVIEDRGSYMIPSDAQKPADKRRRSNSAVCSGYEGSVSASFGTMKVGESAAEYNPTRTILYLKWENDVIARVREDYSVAFTQPLFNSVVQTYTQGRNYWTRGQFEEFLRERIVSRDRRDIERILFRCGLSSYDLIKIGVATRAVHAGDLLWIAEDPSEKMQEAVTDVFSSVFLQKTDAEGDSVDTPEGMNIKRYGVYNGRYGIYKKRISPVTTDAESEIAVSLLAGAMGIPCCGAYRTDEDTVFSVFEYDFAREYVVHFRRLTEAELPGGTVRSGNEFRNLIAARPQYIKELCQMMALDFITRQDDRHLSNIAVKVSPAGESFYPLYDNGRSLFYEDSEETAERACKDIRLFSTTFGPEGTYYDHLQAASESGICFGRIMNLDISEPEIADILQRSGFRGYRFDAALKWISGAIDILRELDKITSR